MLQYGQKRSGEHLFVNTWYHWWSSPFLQRQCILMCIVTWLGSSPLFFTLSKYFIASGYSVRSSMFLEHLPQPLPKPVLLLIDVRHSWPFLHCHHTFLCENAVTSEGFTLQFFLGCQSSAISGKRWASELVSLMPRPLQYGQPSPREVRCMMDACQTCFLLSVHCHHTKIPEPQEKSSGPNPQFFL